MYLFTVFLLTCFICPWSIAQKFEAHVKIVGDDPSILQNNNNKLSGFLQSISNLVYPAQHAAADNNAKGTKEISHTEQKKVSLKIIYAIVGTLTAIFFTGIIFYFSFRQNTTNIDVSKHGLTNGKKTSIVISVLLIFLVVGVVLYLQSKENPNKKGKKKGKKGKKKGKKKTKGGVSRVGSAVSATGSRVTSAIGSTATSNVRSATSAITSTASRATSAMSQATSRANSAVSATSNA